VLEFVEARQPGEVLKIRLEIGELMCVEAEQLRFCFDSIKKETDLNSSSLEIATVPAVVKCPHCTYEGPAKRWDGGLSNGSIATLQCPACGKAAQAIQGHDCAIKSIQLSNLRSPEAVMPADLDCPETHHECDPFFDAIPSEI
jgi:hydrogenase nickel incorporation protein HypA/HybF